MHQDDRNQPAHSHILNICHLHLGTTAKKLKLWPALNVFKIYTTKAIIKFSALADASPRHSICCLDKFHNNVEVTVITVSKMRRLELR